MIVSIEGPDKAGKSTLVAELKRQLGSYLWARFVQVQLYPELMPHMSLIEQISLDHWTSMYDPNKLYICDRSVFVSAPVYGELYGRPKLDLTEWMPRVRVIYIDVPTAELQRRYEAVGDTMFDIVNYEAIKAIYERRLSNYTHIRLNGLETTESLAHQVINGIRVLANDQTYGWCAPCRSPSL